MNSRSGLGAAVRVLCAAAVLFISGAALAATGDFIVSFNGAAAPAQLASRVAALGGSVAYVHAGAGIAVVRGLDASTAAQLVASGGITDAVADAKFSVTDFPGPGKGVSRVLSGSAVSRIASPTDPTTAIFYGLGWQWNMQAIHAEEAWSRGKLGSPSVTVAVIDTGIDYGAIDLDGLVDLSRSVSFVPSDDALAAALFPGVHPSTDLHGHGTHVASQISSNAIVFAGLTSRTRLISVKVVGVQGTGFVSTALMGVLYAADQGADVANMSLGGMEQRNVAGPEHLVSSLQRTFNYAKKQGMLLVVGAANDATDLDHNGNAIQLYCNGVHAVCVSATGPLVPTGSPYVPAIYTNYGRSAITVAAPGGNYGGPVSIWPWGSFGASLVWGFCSRTLVVVDGDGNPIDTPCTSGLVIVGNVGTSLATPHVSGLAALLAADTGKREPSQLQSRLLQCTVDLGTPGVDPFYGRGHIDLAPCMR